MEEFDVKSLWPDWNIVRLIGEGSFGKVYEIVRSNFGIEEHSAMKVIKIPSSQAELQSLRNEGMDDNSTTEYYRGLVEEFVQEIALMSKLRGKANIVGYEDYAVIEHKDSIGWDIVIRMELLTDLPSYIRKNSFCVNDIIKLAVDVCSALEVCHEQKIIHRDIKPDNIFVSQNGDFKLGDFGVARTIEKTVSGLSKKGTYTYMAPEVYKGDPYGTNVDLYSLGIVMYKLLNNNREPFLPAHPAPIKYSDKNDALARRLSGESIPLPASADVASAYHQLGQIVLKACSFKSSDRYQTPTQMKIELKNVSTQGTCSESVVSTENFVSSKTLTSSTNNTVKEQQIDKTMSAFGDDIPVSNFGVQNPRNVTSTNNTSGLKVESISEQQPDNKNNKMTAVLVLGWFGFVTTFVMMLLLFPYTVIQTIGIFVSMILLTLKKNIKISAIVMLVASALSFSILNVVASIIALVAAPKRETITQSHPSTTNNNTVCGKCGSVLVDGAAFCGKCGEPQMANHNPDKTMGVFDEVPHFQNKE